MSFTETGAFDFARFRGMLSAQYPAGITEIFIPPKPYIKIPGGVSRPLRAGNHGRRSMPGFPAGR